MSLLLQINKILAQLRKNLDNNEIIGDLLLLVKGKEQYPLMKELLRNHKFVPHVPGESAMASRYVSLFWIVCDRLIILATFPYKTTWSDAIYLVYLCRFCNGLYLNDSCNLLSPGCYFSEPCAPFKCGISTDIDLIVRFRITGFLQYVVCI